MGLKWDATLEDSVNFYVDDHNMMLARSPDWAKVKDGGAGDSIGRTFLAYLTYEDDRFLEGIKNCWDKTERKGWLRRLLFGKYYYQGYRHPVSDRDHGLSRDHTLYTILAYKHAGYSDEYMKEFVKHLRYKISDTHRFSINLWLWVRVVAGMKIYTPLYYIAEYFALFFALLGNVITEKFAKFGEESHQDDFIKMQNDDKTKRTKILTSFYYPVYAVHQAAYQNRLLKDSFLKRGLQKLLLKMTPRYNYAIQLLLDQEVSGEDVYSYKSMAGWRWTAILNTYRNNRDIYIYTKNIDYNVLDVDYIQKLYEDSLKS
jgi:hypothetical protein